MRNQEQTPSTFCATAAHKQRTNYERSVKVFNSSVEIRVEKHLSMVEIACRNHALLLFAQVRVQTPKIRLRCENKILKWKNACKEE
ncbi:MAG: hypothetical protein WA581_09880 [Candidatus Acidiferrales bacterium]